MIRLTDEAFDEEKLPAHIEPLRPRFQASEGRSSSGNGSAARIVNSFTEVPAAMDLGIGDIRLTGIADGWIAGGRNDRHHRLQDGSSPSAKEARALLDPQLALEAAALRAGAFV